MITAVCILALAATLVAWFKTTKKNKVLQQSVADLGRQVEKLAKPKPFGLTAIEAVGRVLGGLTAEVVRVAYAAAAVCERPNMVAEDTVDALNAQSVAISGSEARIRELEDEVREEQADLATLKRRQTAIAEIEALLPKKQ